MADTPGNIIGLPALKLKENVLITAGSQQLFFLAINSFCGMGSGSVMKKALIPMLPDYSG